LLFSFLKDLLCFLTDCLSYLSSRYLQLVCQAPKLRVPIFSSLNFLLHAFRNLCFTLMLYSLTQVFNITMQKFKQTVFT
jgi:hypothetical protein